MIRGLYRCLIQLHPSAFRSQFGHEMLLTFDEAAETWGTVALLIDINTSLVRQWLFHPHLWRGVAAIIGGILTLVVGFGSFIPWASVWRAFRLTF